MRDCGFTGPDVWYAHGIFFEDHELDFLASSGTGVAHCPSSNSRLGSGICRVREMVDRGVPLGLAVDGSASNDSSDMLGEARQAMLLQRVRYGAGGLTAKEALRIASAGGAALLGWPDAGRVEVGALADLALFRVDGLAFAGAQADPVAALLFCGGSHLAEWVIVNGRVAVEKGRLAGTDEEKLAADANRVAAELYRKAGIAPW
jgi:cytosine/adenosine deaminase-related metal-dependent hydrolase